jgi:hypothetical protein
VKTFEDTQTFIDSAVHQHNNNQATTFAILYRGDLVGVAGFNHFDYQHKWGAMGYWLCASYTGSGVMTKVAQNYWNMALLSTVLTKSRYAVLIIITRAEPFLNVWGFPMKRPCVNVNGYITNMWIMQFTQC